MNREEILNQERRLAELTFDESPCHAFRIEQHGRDVESWVELQPEEDGKGFLRDWLSLTALQHLRSIGVSTQGEGLWTLALDFGEHGWSTYILRAMLVSSWTGVFFEDDRRRQPWPEGVLLDPDEEDLAVSLLSDFYGLALPTAEGWTVLGFIAEEYNELTLNQLLDQFGDGTYSLDDYLAEHSPLVGLPRPAITLQFPAGMPLEPLHFVTPQSNIQVTTEDDGELRLFQDHWMLRLLNPPAKESHHE